jgi:uncharacterized protein (TIGR02597 family)
VILAPDTLMAVRNEEAGPLVYLTAGYVSTDAKAQVVQADAAQTDDTYTSTKREVAIKLKDLGLGGTAAFESSIRGVFFDDIKDQLLVFDNGTGGKDKSPSVTYYYVNGMWVDLNDPSVSADDATIPASAGVVIRKVSGATAPVVWSTPSPIQN